MKKILVVTTFFLGALAAQAQEKVMNILKTDGTTMQTRVAELKQLSFLTVEEGGQGVLVTTNGGETIGVLFEENPVVTVANEKLTITSTAPTPAVFEITDIAEIKFGDTSEATGIDALRDFAFILKDGGALLRGIPEGVKPKVYAIDGRSIPTPTVSNGELRINRATLGTGIFILKVGTFTTKIKL